jgi:hypothetical protein
MLTNPITGHIRASDNNIVCTMRKLNVCRSHDDQVSAREVYGLNLSSQGEPPSK